MSWLHKHSYIKIRLENNIVPKQQSRSIYDIICQLIMLVHLKYSRKWIDHHQRCPYHRPQVSVDLVLITLFNSNSYFSSPTLWPLRNISKFHCRKNLSLFKSHIGTSYLRIYLIKILYFFEKIKIYIPW